jgi:beta-N-acetylhexosaminidase
MPKAFICGCSAFALTPEERSFLRENRPWGFILFKRNVGDRDQLRALIRAFRECVGRRDAPVLIDQEGGKVQRMGPPHWRVYPAAAAIEAGLPPADAEAAARLIARLIAADLSEVGISVDCAPVLDVVEKGTHAAIGSRAYSEDPARVAAMGRAFATGLVAGGVLPVIKHMPGHGRARSDSHHELPVVQASREDLNRDFAPFAALRGLPMAMTAHVVYSGLDPGRPATTSPVVVRDIMRGEIAYDGLIMSDDVSMKALHGPYDGRSRAIIEAGLDLVLHCNGDLDEARAVASAAPELAGEALRRSEAALAARREPEPFDRGEAEARLGAISDRLSAG